MLFASRFAGEVVLVAYLNGVGGAQAIYSPIFEVDAGYPIACGSHNVRVFEAHLLRPWGDERVSVLGAIFLPYT